MRLYFQKSLNLHKTTGDLFLQLEPLEQFALDLFDQGDLRSSESLYQETLRISEALGNSLHVACCYFWLSLIAWQEGKDTPAMEYAQKAYQIFTDIGNKYWTGAACCYLGQVYWYENRIEEARAKFIEAMEISRQIADPGSYRHNISFLSRFSYYRGSADDVREYIDEAQSIPMDDPSWLRLLYLAKAYFARLEKRFSDAKQDYLIAFRMIKDTLATIHVPEALQGLAVLFLDSGQLDPAVSFLGMATEFRRRAGTGLGPDQQAELDRSISSLRELLSEAEFARLWEEGRSVTVEQAFQEAESAIATGG